MLRKLVFWPHLVVGLGTGIVVFLLCLSGAILEFEWQWVDWAESDARALASGDSSAWLSPDALIAKAAAVETDKVVNIEWFSDPKMPVRLRTANQHLVLLNPFTGEVLGRGATSLRAFFQWVTNLHTNLVLKVSGDWIVSIGNCCFVFLVLSGLFLWWPRQWHWKALRNSMAMRFDVKGKARDWNWHNALGFWFLLPLFFIAATGIVLSFNAANLWWGTFASEHLLAAPQPVKTLSVATPTNGKTAPGWSDWMRTVRQHFPSWRSIALSTSKPLDPQAELSFTINRGLPNHRTSVFKVKLDKATNTIMQESSWTSDEGRNRARAIVRLGHTGEILGLGGQVLAFLACLAGLVLVYTGFALSWRRFGFGGRA